MTKVGYVVVRENLDDPLVQSQCRDVVEEINGSWAAGQVELIWFYRIDYIFRAGNPGLHALRRSLLVQGISATFIPFISVGFPVRWWAIPLVVPQWLLGVCYLRFRLGFRILHCRSYHAGLVGFFACKWFKMKYIFDPRSPFPEENVAAERWTLGSLSYRLWKNIETRIVNHAASTILVAQHMSELYRGLEADCRFDVVPNNYPAVFDVEQVKLPAESDPYYDLVYIGSFGHWNNPGPYLQLLSQLNSIDVDKFNMLFIVRTNAKAEIERQAEKYEVAPSCFDIVSVAQSEVTSYLRNCRFGIYLMEAPDPRLGVKTVEYLATGRPVIVSTRISGAAYLLKTERLGISWDHSEHGVREIHHWMRAGRTQWTALSQRCQQFAQAYFSPQAVGRKLIRVYEETMM